jgi:hypothetical protein
MSKTESFLEYYVHVDIILGEYFLTRKTKSLLKWKNILPHVHGRMIFMDESMDVKMDELYFEHWQQTLFLQKK